MIGGFADCCARVLSGQPATAPPRSVMNSRFLICLTGCWGRASPRLTCRMSRCEVTPATRRRPRWVKRYTFTVSA